jgi:hypothetical protein
VKVDLSEILAGAKIIGADGTYFGTVDTVEGSVVRLAEIRSPASCLTTSACIAEGFIDSVANGIVWLRCAAADVRLIDIASDQRQATRKESDPDRPRHRHDIARRAGSQGTPTSSDQLLHDIDEAERRVVGASAVAA